MKLNKDLFKEIKSLEYNFRYGKKQFYGYKVWHIDWWDGRTAAVKKLKSEGINKEYVGAILKKIVSRRIQKETIEADVLTQEQRISFLRMVNECTFNLEAKSGRYNCTGIDWKAFHRPASSGGWVLIAPDEPGNNWHTKDPILVKYLNKKFLKS